MAVKNKGICFHCKEPYGKPHEMVTCRICGKKVHGMCLERHIHETCNHSMSKSSCSPGRDVDKESVLLGSTYGVFVTDHQKRRVVRGGE